MDFSELLHGSVIIITWVSLGGYMDFSNLLFGLVKVVTWICQKQTEDFKAS